MTRAGGIPDKILTFATNPEQKNVRSSLLKVKPAMDMFLQLLPAIVVLILFTGLWLVLRNRASSTDVDGYLTLIGQGDPVVLKFFRNT